MTKVELYYNKKLDIELIRETFELSFNKKFDREYWEWRFLKNPNDQKVYISYIIEDNKLAAYYAVSPCIIQIDKEEHKIALSNMTMTHPDYRGKGYFKLLANKLYEALKQNGYIGVYGFANSNSHYGFRKYLDWNDLTVLNNFKVTPKRFRGFLIEGDRFSFVDNIITKEILNKFKSYHISNLKIKVNRDFNNYLWRFLENPSNQYESLIVYQEDEAVGVLYYKIYGNEVDIMEILSKKLIYKDSILIEGVKHLIKKLNNTINIWSNLHSSEHILLEKFGFQEASFSTYFGIIPFVDNVELLRIANWHFRFYDSDIY